MADYKNLTPEEFRDYLRDLQGSSSFRWPNHYFVWEKPDQTLLMIGISSTQVGHILMREFEDNPIRASYGIPGDYATYFYSIDPKVVHLKSGGKRYDPVEELVDKVRDCKYLGFWEDPDLLMDHPTAYFRTMACGRWDLAMKHITENDRHASLDEKISGAVNRAGQPSPGHTPEPSRDR